jgi:predicted transcriptional regulator
MVIISKFSQLRNCVIFVCCLKCANGHYSDIMAASTHDQDVFSFYPDERICNGFEEVLSRYREIVPNIRLAGYISTTYLVLLMRIMLINVIDIVILSQSYLCFNIRPYIVCTYC